MSISDKFLNIINKSILKQQESELKNLKKEKKEINKKIKAHIMKNRPLFKKIKLYDFFNINLLAGIFVGSMLSTFAYIILTFIIEGLTGLLDITGLLNFNINNMSTKDMFYIASPETLGLLLCLISGALMLISSIFKLEGEKGELFDHLNELKGDREKILNNIKKINYEKKDIDYLIRETRNVDKFKSEEWLLRPIEAELLKSLPLYFSDDEMSLILLNAKSNSITYYTIVDIIEKIKRNKNYKERVEMMKEMSVVKELVE